MLDTAFPARRSLSDSSVTSWLPRLDFWVEPLEFDSGDACRKLPVSFVLVVVSGGGPFVESLGGLVLADNAVGKALRQTQRHYT